MQKTITRQQVGMFLAMMPNEAIVEGEAKLKEKIGEENFNILKDLENQILRELAEGKTEFTVDIPDHIVELVNQQEDEEEEVEVEDAN